MVVQGIILTYDTKMWIKNKLYLESSTSKDFSNIFLLIVNCVNLKLL